MLSGSFSGPRVAHEDVVTDRKCVEAKNIIFNKWRYDRAADNLAGATTAHAAKLSYTAPSHDTNNGSEKREEKS